MKIFLSSDHDTAIASGAVYALETLLDILGVSYAFESDDTESGLHLHYGFEAKGADVLIPADDSVPWRGITPHLTYSADENLPIIYLNVPPHSSLMIVEDDQIKLGFDLIAPTLWLLSRQEEVDPSARDQYGRFSASQSWLVQRGLIEKPMVNLYAHLLERALSLAAKRRGWPWVTIKPWPNGRAYALCLAHDVDEVRYYDPKAAGRLLIYSLRHQHLRGIPRSLLAMLRGLGGKLQGIHPDPSWNFERIMALEREHDVRSTFYFVPSTSSGSRDPAYDIADPEVSSIIARLQEAGWEVAVHGSFQSYADASQLIYERNRLAAIAGAELFGIRQHYLRLAIPQTFRAQAKAGLVYDASLGYPDVLGFRAGAASPFWIFDAQVQSKTSLLELPLTVMDGALFWGLDYESQEAVQHTLELLNTIRQVRGLGMLLWHQRVWDEQRYPGWGDAYAALLQYVRNEDEAWVVPACEVATWWQARRSLLQNSLGSSSFQLTYHPSQNLEEVYLDVCSPPERTLRLKAGRGEVRVLSKHHFEVRIDKLSAGDGLELEFIA